MGDFEATIFRTLAQIAEQERLKATKKEEYLNASFIGILEGILREAEKDAKKN